YCALKEGLRAYCHPNLYLPLHNTLYRNNGDGTFTDVSHETGIDALLGKGMAVTFADFDGDGFLDAFVTNDTMPNFLFRNIGGKKFEEIAVAAGVAYSPDGDALSGMGSDFRDVNNDGLPDIWHTAVEHEGFPLYINQGGGTFVDANNTSGLGPLTNRMTGWSNGIYDFDNDGWKDFFVARANVMDNIQQAIPAEAYPEPNTVFRNLGNGKFQDVSPSAGPSFQIAGAHRGAAFGDLFNTGRIDAVVSSLNEPIKLFRNIGAAGQHWLLLRLVGTRSNRMGLGAQIKITTPDGRAQWNEATTAVGYACSSDPRVHFGLGPNTLVKEMQITWPSRTIQRLANISADQILTIEEPKS
ncbi:MAG: CRTAC1 family protein, partial [Terracidiphilus sp.]